MNMYEDCAKKHTIKDQEVGWKEVRKIERTANHHSKVVSRIFNIGQHLDKERWEIAVKVTDSKPPDTRFHVKDHKKIPDGQNHPDTRRVDNATDGPLSRNQNISTLRVDKMADEMKDSSECIDTEQMKQGS